MPWHSITRKRDLFEYSVPHLGPCGLTLLSSLRPVGPGQESYSPNTLGLLWWIWEKLALSFDFYLLEWVFSSVAQLCLTLCNPMDCRTPGFSVHHQLLEFTQTYVHHVSDAIQPSHPLSSPSPDFNLSQHQGLFKWVSSSHQVAKILEFQLQHQSFQWTPRTDLL